MTLRRIMRSYSTSCKFLQNLPVSEIILERRKLESEKLLVAIGSLSEFIREHYEVHEWKHATAILEKDFPDQWRDIIEVLTSFRLRKSYIDIPGGNKSLVADALDRA